MSEVAPLQRKDVLLGMLQKEYPNYHPLLSIVRIAHNHDADLKLQFECHKTIAKYVEPELKSIEVRGGMDHKHSVKVSMFEDKDLEALQSEPLENPVLEHNPSVKFLGELKTELDMDPVVTDRLVENDW